MFNNKKAIVMYFKDYPNIKIALALIIPLGLFSCGSYQYASDNDGIYSSEPEVVYTEEVEQPADANVSYYQNYFKEKRMQYDSMKEESEIFIDVDSYSSENGENYREQDSLDNSYKGYGSWGSDSNEVIVNIYDNSWINPYWGWGWNAGWGWGYPYYGWGWNVGWGWGYPYYGWGWNAGWGWGYPYYGGGYYYGSRGVAISGRRGANYLGYNNRNSLNTRNALASNGRSNSLTRDYDAIRSSNTRSTTRSSYTPTRSVRTRSNLSTPRTRNTNSYSNPRSRSNNSSYSSPGRSRSNNNTRVNSSSRPSRSSSSGGSFGSSSRGSSSGGVRSSSGSSGRRR